MVVTAPHANAGIAAHWKARYGAPSKHLSPESSRGVARKLARRVCSLVVKLCEIRFVRGWWGFVASFPESQNTRRGSWAALRQIARSTRATWKHRRYCTSPSLRTRASVRSGAVGDRACSMAVSSLLHLNSQKEERGASELPHREGEMPTLRFVGGPFGASHGELKAQAAVL
jgi:hypothetical protein